MVGVNHFKALIGSSVNEHKSNFSPDSDPKDFIESYLQEITKTTDPTSSFYKETGGTNLSNIRCPINSHQSSKTCDFHGNCLFSEKSLSATVGALFGAGSETTSSLVFEIIFT